MPKLDSLIRRRRESGLSQRHLARLAGVGAVTVCRVELGLERAKPITLAKLAQALGIEPDELMDAEEPKVRVRERRYPSRISPPTVSWRDLVDLPRLGAERMRAGVSYQQLERLSGVGAVTIAAIEAGHQSARIATARRLAAALGKHMSDLMELDPSEPPLRMARYRAGMSIMDLHLHSGVSRKTILATERGRRARPETLAQLARALQVDVDDLLERNAARTSNLRQRRR
jgi:transcriptional regulator with XRE-family HTH domain